MPIAPAVPVKPRRSVLYMPGANERALEKAADLDCDAIILDLEDAVAPDRKAEARERVCAKVADKPYGHREVIIRINALTSEWGHADLEAAADVDPDAILLPKVERADAVREAELVMDGHGARHATKLWAMMETPRGILAAEAIAAATPRLTCFVIGTSDLAKELRCAHGPGRAPFLTSLQLCLLAARGYGLAILDGVYLDLEDADGLAAECRQGAQMGFDGKTLIHPKQIDAANIAFRPDDAEVDRARRILKAWQEAAREGKGVALLDGRLIENLHVDNAKRVLALKEAIGAR